MNTETNSKRLKTLVVMSGGGMPGLSIYAGILRAFYVRGIVADVVHGTSAGAIAGALWMAKKFDGLSACNTIVGLQDADVRDEVSFWKLRHRWLNYFMHGEKIQAVIQEHMPEFVYQLPATFRAYMVQDGTGSLYASQPSDSLWESVRASSAIRGVFPPVKMLDGNYYTDGGTKANVPLPRNWREYDRVIICIATQPVEYKYRTGIISNLFYSIHELMEGQVDRVLQEIGGDLFGKKVLILRPPVKTDKSTLRFDHSLVNLAHRYTLKALESWN